MGPIGVYAVAAAGWPGNHAVPKTTQTPPEGYVSPGGAVRRPTRPGKERNCGHAIPMSGHRRHSRPIHCCCTTAKTAR